MSFRTVRNQGIPKTGQSTSYQDFDDAYYAALGNGYPKVGTDVVDNGDGTITVNSLKMMFIAEPELIIPGDNKTIGLPSTLWATSVSYAVGDMVYVNQDNTSWFSSGQQYPYPGTRCRFRCNTAHTSSNFQNDFNSGKWQEQALGNNYNQIHAARGSWAQNTHYKVADLIDGYDGVSTKYYVILMEHDSANPSGTTWAPSNGYTVGDVVIDQSENDPDFGNNYTTWKCLVNHTSRQIFTYANSISYSTYDVVYDASSSGAYFQCMNGHTSNGSNIQEDITNNGATNWKLLQGSSGNMAQDAFIVDRFTNPTYWTLLWKGTDFQHAIIDHPEYFRVTTWTNSSSNPPRQPNNNLNWSDSIAACQALDYAGFTDWRMPNFNEMLALVRAGLGTNSSDNHPIISGLFRNINTGWYWWTSTTYPTNTSSALTMQFNNNNLNISNSGKTGTGIYVLPCRDIVTTEA